MPTAEALVATDRPSRYLTQLCRHTDQMAHRPHAHGGAPRVEHAEGSATEGVIEFGHGQCTLQATPEGLLLRAEATDAKNLRRIQDGIAARLETIARRDGLTVEWGASETPATGSGPRRWRPQTLVLAVVIALVVALHLGLAGAVLSDSRRTWANALLLIPVMVLVAVKLRVLRRLVRRGGGHR